MSEQKDEFEDYLISLIARNKAEKLNQSNTITNLKEYTSIIKTAKESLEKYQEIKAKNVCKNCKHNTKTHSLTKLYCPLVHSYVDENFSCGVFLHAT